ncbi:MAG TPA: alanine racemase, partial [Candidatus Acetothermia bacterium]|nr:alanine racemase [Candidatus Acetothermia bacterium]
MPQTIARIDLSALAENMEYVCNRLPQQVKVLFAVKSDGYGHGIEAVSRTAEEVGIDYLGANTVEEGEKIRSAGVKLPILLLGPILPSE